MKGAKFSTEVTPEPVVVAAPKKKKPAAKKSTVWRKRQIAVKKAKSEEL